MTFKRLDAGTEAFLRDVRNAYLNMNGTERTTASLAIACVLIGSVEVSAQIKALDVPVIRKRSRASRVKSTKE